MSGEDSVQENPLLYMNKVLLPPLRIERDIMNNFVKVIYKTGSVFQNSCTLFQALSSVKTGVLVRPQIQEVLKDNDFGGLLTLKERRV